VAAFTDEQKAAIRDVLGYPDVTTYPNFRLEGAFASCSDVAADRVLTMLAQIEQIDAAVVQTALEGRFREVEDVKFRDNAQGTVNAGRLTLARRIANIFGVNVATDIGSGGFTRQ
jgi:hypothetical protein